MEPGSLIVGRYRLDAPIASGGMGTVWRGFDTRLKRAVAVKILKSGFERDENARARFEHEAQAVASLRHNGIAALHDYGETADEQGAILSYLVMELIEGRSLAEVLLGGPMDPAEAMRLCAQVAGALQAAHEAGIIHRDVKPANIILDERGRAVLVDFGIALSAGRTAITESGLLLGTLYYASPEQLEGHELTIATDVYSLGAVAYECLAGTPPFTGDTAGTILNGHLNQPPPQFPETVPPAPAAVVFQALAKSPENRWNSASAFAEAGLRAAEHPEEPHADPALFAPAPAMPAPTGPHPFPAPVLPPRPSKRKRLMVIMPTAAVAIVAAAAAVMLSPWFSEAGDGGGEQGTLAVEGASSASERAPAAAATSTPGPSASETTSTAAAEADGKTTEPADDGGAEEAIGGEDENEPSQGSTEDDSGTVEGSPPNLPDVRGIDYIDARDELVSQGWEKVSLVPDSNDPDNGQTECSVLYQDPDPGSPTDYDTPITLTYLEFADGNC
ncbi:serine/threonine-protein kinase [Glycomyces luteolus]|uniref:non-specific serine/threonine protein kinase n=1 Tax=Glycomyces luteolus TaxID=2670330 RepID=A0A9X3PAD4_9ACTN|nr:serine/threonine-protein kinase [Glycomyces luteolus]MDA1359625.1 serine/threonine-protein kinase [Glycomyces luteolus]